MTTYGPGAMIDLPWFAAVVCGLDFWDKGVRISGAAAGGQGQGRPRRGYGRAGDPARIRQDARRDDQERASSPGGSRRWSLTKETKRASDPDKRTYQTRMMVPLAWVDRADGLL